MQVQRLISKGSLVADGRMVQLPEITKSQNHIITGGGGDVIDVTKCDKSEPEETSAPETAPHTPLWQHIGDMFPEVKPHASMEAWDDDCAF
jgi:hypothetical protein